MINNYRHSKLAIALGKLGNTALLENEILFTMTETHSLEDWEKEFDKVFDDEWENVLDRESDRRDLVKSTVKDHVCSLLLAQKEGFRREIEGLKKDEIEPNDEGQIPFAKTMRIRGRNEVLDDLLTKLDTNGI